MDRLLSIKQTIVHRVHHRGAQNHQSSGHAQSSFGEMATHRPKPSRRLQRRWVLILRIRTDDIPVVTSTAGANKAIGIDRIDPCFLHGAATTTVQRCSFFVFVPPWDML